MFPSRRRPLNRWVVQHCHRILMSSYCSVLFGLSNHTDVSSQSPREAETNSLEWYSCVDFEES